MNFLKRRACVKSIIGSLVIPRDKILDTLKTETINSNYIKVTSTYFDHSFIDNCILINNRCYLL